MAGTGLARAGDRRRLAYLSAESALWLLRRDGHGVLGRDIELLRPHA